jgi:hypothetical protein
VRTNILLEDQRIFLAFGAKQLGGMIRAVITEKKNFKKS